MDTHTTNLAGRMELSVDLLEACLPSIWFSWGAMRVFGKIVKEIYHSSLSQVAAASGSLIEQ